MNSELKKASLLLSGLKGKKLTREERIEKTLELASLLLVATDKGKTRSEKRREKWLARMVADQSGRSFITALTDQCFRSSSPKRSADQLVYLIKYLKIPRFLEKKERIKLLLFRWLGTLFPTFFISQFKKQIRKEFAHVLLPEDQKSQTLYFLKCKKDNIRLNLNHLGEAILGEGEAKRRLILYLEDLKNPLIDYISVKISTLFSQINMIAWESSLETLATRLRLLYRGALESTPPKFVNLDMEEYKDLDLTIALFKKVQSEPEFLHYQGGLVLQSYLPDAFERLEELTRWALKRVAEGGAPIKIRLVKGANLAMEAVESSLRGWELAPFSHKSQTDANLKKMLEFATLSEHTKAVHIGLGSHNLFDIAYCFILRALHQTEKEVSFEMLKGMGESLCRTVHNLAGEILLYCPESAESTFQNAVAYLIRRLDENSGEENFLHHFFELKVGNRVWNEEAEKFRNAVLEAPTLSSARKRSQNRLLAPLEADIPFHNEPDTDFSLPENREWVSRLFIPKTYAPPPLADEKQVDDALHCAQNSSWKALPFSERNQLLAQVAITLRRRRGALLAVMLAESSKTIWEGDPEVSEAIDFVDYYRKNWEESLSCRDIEWKPRGTLLVAPPWNFPCSIPVGGIAAALTAGNAVLFKPAPEAVLIGWELVRCFWDSGVPKEALHFLNCPDEPIGSYLIRHPKLNGVILTGATATARHFMRLNPHLNLYAETGGKNALIITAMSDRDLAIHDLIHSAFGHSGQKCSACSLAILEGEVYDDPHFLRSLKEAAESLVVGSAWEPTTRIGPLIRPPEKNLLKGLTTLEKGETWLLEPKQYTPHLWSPGIKLGIKEGSFMHQTELFGPLLGLMRASTLDEALRFANGTPYGLTSGLHSLDVREQLHWRKHIIAGNLYINRGITGAIVGRQPFGGCKASSFGSGAKAGGPYYVAQFAIPSEIEPPHEKAPLPPSLLPLFPSLSALTEEERAIWKKSAENYAYWAKILTEPRPVSSLLGQDNYHFHVPLGKIYLRLHAQDPLLSVLQVRAACLICQTHLEISQEESEESLLQRLQEGDRLRFLSQPSRAFLKAAAEKGLFIQAAPLLSHGKVELLHYMREVSLSIDYHRYGYLGLRYSIF